MQLIRQGFGHRILRLGQSRRGSALVEFALVAAPFIGLMLAILQTSLLYLSQQGLETAVEVATRSVITGKAQAADATGATQGLTAAQMAERFRAAGCTALPPFLSCSRLMVDVRSGTSWSSLDTAMPVLTFDKNGKVTNSFSYDLGSRGSIVIVRFLYLWPVQAMPLFTSANAANGERLLAATSVAKSESFS